MIPTNFDIRWNVANQRRSGPSEQNVLSRCLKFVVRYLERTRTVPAINCLSVLTQYMNIRNVRINYCQRCSVKSHAALDVPIRRTVNVAAVDGDIVRKL